MTTEIIEVGNRVFECSVTPDDPGCMRRTLTMKLLSGPALTQEEYEHISAQFVADAISKGIDVVSWGAEEDAP